MKTFLLVKLGFLPAILFWTLSGFGQTSLALDLGALVGAGCVAWNWRGGRERPMETALFGYLALAALARHAGWSLDGLEVAGSFAVMGLAGAWTCLRGRPWTSGYSATSFTEMTASPLFKAVNLAMSALWSGIFLALAAIDGFALGTAWSRGLTLAGAVISIFGPKLVIRLLVGQQIRARERYRWPTPRFDGAGEVDVAIVGAGIGGLTAAALLAQAGLRVVVAEHHVVPGGFAHSWLRKTRHNGEPRLFRFDSGVHDISGVRPGGPVTGLLARLGARVEWLAMPHAMWLQGAPFEVAQDWREHARRLGERFPASAAGLLGFFEEVKQIYDGMFSLGEGQSGVPLPPRDAAAMLAFPRAHPAAFRWMGKPFAELVAAHVQEPEPQAALYRLAGYVTDRPEELGVFDMVPLFGYYFHGGYYPKGGSGMLGQVLADAVTRHGGQVRLKSAVAEILVENGRAVGIRLASGERIAARAVMSNADLRRTFLTLLPEAAVPEEFRAVMAAAEPATSAFMVHLGLDRQPELPPIASVETADGLKVGLVSPSKVDPSAAPAGYATLELITLLPQAEARRWFPEPEVVDAKAYRGSAEYEAAKQALGDRLITAAEQLIPGLRGHIVLRVDASPLTFARYDWSSGGAIYGVAQRDRFDGVKSPLPGLYLAGAGNQGPGVEAVMIAGARAAESIIPGLLRRAPARAEPAPAPRWNAELSLARG